MGGNLIGRLLFAINISLILKAFLLVHIDVNYAFLPHVLYMLANYNLLFPSKLKYAIQPSL